MTAAPGGFGPGASWPSRTGHPEVDAVLDALADIPTVGLDDQVGRYTQAHDALRRILQSIDGDGGTPR